MDFSLRRAWPTLIGLVALAAFALIASSARPVFAAGIVVNTNADNTTSGDNFCTLREAILAAQGTDNDCGTGVTGQTITFDGSVTTIALQPQTVGDAASAELPNITGTVVIDGGGIVTVDAQGSRPNPDTDPVGTPTSRVVTVTATGDLTVENIWLINGYPASSSGGILRNDGGTLTVTDSTLSGGNTHVTAPTTDANGAAITSTGTLHVSGSTFSNNTAGNATTSPVGVGGKGGAIMAGGPFTTIESSTFSDNTAYGIGGAIEAHAGIVTVSGSTFSGNSAGSGGAIDADGGSTTVSGSTFTGNTALTAGGAILGFNGPSGSLTVINSTLTGNSAPSGGGISNSFLGTVTVLNSTVANNTATGSGGGIGGSSSTRKFVVSNTIVANNTGGDCGTGSWSGTTNLSSDATCTTAFAAGFTQSSTIDLGTLGYHGGPTETILLLPGSSAIDAGDSTVCSDAGTVNNLDQRGETRPFDGNGDGVNSCDIGAVEIVQTDIGTPVTVTVSSTDVGYGEPATLTATGVPAGATGTVTFKTPDDTVICTATLPATSCTSDPDLPVGTSYTDIHAFYGGDTTHYPEVSTNGVDLSVVKTTADISVGISDDHPPFGTPATLTATGIPDRATGTVTFKTPDGTVVCTATLPATTCMSDPDLPAGTSLTDIAAYYSGDDNFNGSTSPNTVDLIVGKANTTVTATATYYDWAPVPTVAIHVDVESLGPIPVDDDGTVSFYNGSTLLCTVPVKDSEALCEAPLDPSGVSPHSLTAVYNGSGNFNGSTTTTDVVEHLASPTISQVTRVFPNNGTAWLLQGGGFSGASNVTICGVSVPFTVINDNLMLVGIPAISGPHQCGITVTAAGGTGSTPGNLTVVPQPGPGAPVVVYPTGPVTPPPPDNGGCSVMTITLYWRWTLIGWPGKTLPVLQALEGDGTTCTNDIEPYVQVVWGFDAATQTYHAYFPDYTDVPGANDLDEMVFGDGYWIALKRQADAPLDWKIVPWE